MRYDVLKRVRKNRFVMLLIDFWNCKIDVKCEKNEKVNKEVKISYFVIKRDRRENVVVDFDRETISTQNIDFFDVEVDVINEVIDEIDEINNVNIAIDVWSNNVDVKDVNENKVDEVTVAIDEEIKKTNKEDDVVIVIVIEDFEKDEIDEVSNESDEIDFENIAIEEDDVIAEKEEFSSLKSFANFACFVRTCSCNLILLTNFLKHRLQAKIFAFFFVIRAFSVCCCCNWRVCSVNRCCLIYNNFIVLFAFRAFFACCKWCCIDRWRASTFWRFFAMRVASTWCCS